MTYLIVLKFWGNDLETVIFSPFSLPLSKFFPTLQGRHFFFSWFFIFHFILEQLTMHFHWTVSFFLCEDRNIIFMFFFVFKLFLSLMAFILADIYCEQRVWVLFSLKLMWRSAIPIQSLHITYNNQNGSFGLQAFAVPVNFV